MNIVKLNHIRGVSILFKGSIPLRNDLDNLQLVREFWYFLSYLNKEILMRKKEFYL